MPFKNEIESMNYSISFGNKLNKNEEDTYYDDEEEEENCDALNDETFGGNDDDCGDWEIEHEKLTSHRDKDEEDLISFDNNNRGRILASYNDYDEKNYMKERDIYDIDDIVEKSISNLVLEDDFDDPAIMTIKKQSSSDYFNRHMSPVPHVQHGQHVQHGFLDYEQYSTSPKTNNIWSTSSPINYTNSSSTSTVSSVKPTTELSLSCPPGMGQSRMFTLEDIEKELLSKTDDVQHSQTATTIKRPIKAEDLEATLLRSSDSPTLVSSLERFDTSGWSPFGERSTQMQDILPNGRIQDVSFNEKHNYQRQGDFPTPPDIKSNYHTPPDIKPNYPTSPDIKPNYPTQADVKLDYHTPQDIKLDYLTPPDVKLIEEQSRLLSSKEDLVAKNQNNQTQSTQSTQSMTQSMTQSPNQQPNLVPPYNLPKPNIPPNLYHNLNKLPQIPPQIIQRHFLNQRPNPGMPLPGPRGPFLQRQLSPGRGILLPNYPQPLIYPQNLYPFIQQNKLLQMQLQMRLQQQQQFRQMSPHQQQQLLQQQQQQQQQQQMQNRHSFKNYPTRQFFNKNLLENLNNNKDFDEYSGLMTERDKERIVKIHQLQVELKDPYVDDYYYVTYMSKKIKAAADEKGDKTSPNLILPERPRQTSESYMTNSYVPVQFERSLGKIQVSNVNCPRKLLECGLNKSQVIDPSSVSFSDNLVNNTKTKGEISRFRKLLLQIERLYVLLLNIDDEDKRIAALPPHAREQHILTREQSCHKLYKGLVVKNEKINLDIVQIRKGLSLLFRSLSYLSITQRAVILKDLFNSVNFRQYVVKPKHTFDYGKIIINAINTIHDCQLLLDIVSGINDGPAFVKYQLGQEVIKTLLSQFEKLKPNQDIKSKWAIFVNQVLDDADDIGHLRKFCCEHLLKLNL